MPFRDCVRSPGPTKLLALDGGGVRGASTVQILRRPEIVLTERLCAGSTDFVLSDCSVGQAAARAVAVDYFAGFPGRPGGIAIPG
jgi:patatin-like phospholipase/acyl hydrolase